MEFVFFISFLIGLITWLLVKRRASKRNFPVGDGASRRELGDTIESSLFNFHKLGNLHLADVIFITSKEEISFNTISLALHRIGMRHPLMRSRIIERSTAIPPYFEEIEDFATPLIVSECSVWEEIYDDILNDSYEKDELLWKVVYMPNVPTDYIDSTYKYQYTLVFGFRHEMIDESSYIGIFRDLLEDIELLHGGCKKIIESQTLPPSVEDILSSDLRPTTMAAFLSAVVELIVQLPFVKYLFSSNQLPSNPWIEKFGAEMEKTSAEANTRCLPICFTENETDTLVALCKRNDVTVQAAINTAALIAITKIMYEDEIPNNLSQSVCVSVDLRKLYKNEFSDNLHHVASYSIPVNVNMQITTNWKLDFWQIAKDNSSVFKSNLESNCINILKMFRIFGLLVKSGLSVTDMLKRSFGRFETILAFTNVGNCERINAGKSLTKVAARFGSSSEHVAGSIFANNIGTISHKLFWTVTYYENICTKAIALKYANSVKSTLKEVLK